MFEVTEYIGIIAFAISGFFVGARNKLDFLGVLISVFLTALGGGIIRDILVDKIPYTFIYTTPAITILSVMIILILFKFQKRESIENRPWFILSDSIGLVSFGFILYILSLYDKISFPTLLLIFLIGTTIRLLAYYRHWSIPLR